MQRIYEPPVATKRIRRLRTKARQLNRFNELVLGTLQLMDDCCASANMMREALSLALHERAWANDRLQQGIDEEPIEEAIEGDQNEGIDDEEEPV